jgi:hypothetical protein
MNPIQDWDEYRDLCIDRQLNRDNIREKYNSQAELDEVQAEIDRGRELLKSSTSYCDEGGGPNAAPQLEDEDELACFRVVIALVMFALLIVGCLLWHPHPKAVSPGALNNPAQRQPGRVSTSSNAPDSVGAAISLRRSLFHLEVTA